jgi:hypothetical protein
LSGAELLSVAGVVFSALALVGVVYQVRSYRRDNPRRRIDYTVTTRRLVESNPHSSLEIRANGQEVPNPYLAELRLTSNSKADIPSTAFDAGRPIRIRVEPGGAFVVGKVADEGIHTTGGHGNGWEWAEMEIGPQLIRKGARLSLDFISNGQPEVRIESSLVDVPVSDLTRQPKPKDLIKRVFFVVASAILFVAIISNPEVYSEDPWPSWFQPAMGVLYGAFFVVSAGALIVTMKRWVRP